jgi:hypothetical protein
MFTLLQAFGRGIVKILTSLAAGGGVGLLSVGVLATLDPDAWDNHLNHGPPIGPMILSIGAGLMTAAICMGALFVTSWWRPALENGRSHP